MTPTTFSIDAGFDVRDPTRLCFGANPDPLRTDYVENIRYPFIYHTLL